MHGVRTRHYIVPHGGIEFTALIYNPQKQTDSKVTIICPMANKVAAPKRVPDMNTLIANEKLVSERTRFSSAIADSCVFGKE